MRSRHLRGIAGGVEVAGGVALLAARLRTGADPGRYRELRFDGDGAWAVVGHDSGAIAIEPPVVHVSHRAVVVLEVVDAGMRDFLVFTPFSTATADLRRLRVLLRSTGLSR